MNSISKATIQAANSTADALSVVGEFVRLEKKGGRYWGLCPFHNEKTPSFTVNPDQKRYYCFGKVKGGVLTVRFTYRHNRIRIIGAGYWRKGKNIYEKQNK